MLIFCLLSGLVYRYSAKEPATYYDFLLIPLYCHGDPGCGQYGYRYGLPFLPWIFLLLLRSCNPSRGTILKNGLITLSITISAYATYVFRFTKIGFE